MGEVAAYIKHNETHPQEENRFF